MPFKKKPEFQLDEYQKVGVRFHLQHLYSMNADVPGLGKTRQAIGSILVIEKRTIVVAPAYLHDTWKQELKNTELIVQELENENPKVSESTEVLLVTYYQLTKHKAFLESLVHLGGFGFIVIDESHAFKTPEAERTISLGELVTEWRPFSLLLMTGTPVKNGNGAELYIPFVLKNLQPGLKTDFFEKYPSPYTFAMRFSNIRPDGKTKGIKNEDELKKMLSTFMIRRTEEEVGLILGKPIFDDIYVKYPEDPMLWEIFQAFKGDTSMNVQMKMESAACKSPFSAKVIEGLYEQDVGPILCYSEHRSAVEIIRDELKLKRVGVIRGGETKASRDKTAGQFQRGELDVVVATIGSIKEGLNFQVANHSVENDYPWVPSDLIQVRARTRRRGQTKTCVYHRILGCDLDVKINRMIEFKAQQIKKVL